MTNANSAPPSSLLQLRRLQRHFILFLLAIVIPVVAALYGYKNHIDAVTQATLLADIEADARHLQLAVEPVIQVSTSHLARLSVQFTEAMAHPELALNDMNWQNLAQFGVRRIGAGELSGDHLEMGRRKNFGSLFVNQQSIGQASLAKEISAAAALFPAMHAAHQAHPYFQWTYYYSPREDFSALYPFVAARDILQSTGTDNIDAALKVIFDAGGTKPVQMIGPNRNPSRESRWTAPYYDAGGKGAMVSLLHPLYVQDQFAGVMGADVTLVMFSEVLQNARPALGHTLLIDALGNVLADDAGLVQKNKDILTLSKALPGELSQIPLARWVAKQNSLQTLGQWHWIALPLKGTNWNLLFYSSALELKAEAAKKGENNPLIILGLLGILVAAAWGISYYFALPALRLVGYLNQLILSPFQAVPPVPMAWRPSFEQVAATSQERARYLAEVEGYTESLEQTVSERTTELRQANGALLESIEQLKTTQKMLVEAEKMAALGALVAGVAHELNTPIGVGVTMASTLLDKNQELMQQLTEQTLRKSILADYAATNQQGLEILLRNLGQAANLVNSFKKVAVDQTSDQRREFDLAETIHDVFQTMHVLFDSRVELKSTVSAGILLDSYPGALVQVLNNLIANAEAHGFVGRSQGTVTIDAELIPNGWLKLIVSDNGLGVAPEHLAHIFEPFFTTKLGKGGSGLGLSIVYSIVTSILGGKVEASSQIDLGTQFVLTFPLHAPHKHSE